MTSNHADDIIADHNRHISCDIESIVKQTEKDYPLAKHYVVTDPVERCNEGMSPLGKKEND